MGPPPPAGSQDAGLAAAEGAWDLAGLFSSAERLGAAVCGDAGAWAPLASMALMVLHNVLPFPAELLAAANGACFGLAAGIAVTWSGAMLGAVLAFWLAKRLGRPFVARVVAERHLRRLDAFAERGGAGALLVARLIPVIAFNLINYAAGLAGVRWWRFVWTTALGILPATVASVAVGSHMAQAPGWAWAVLGAVIVVVALLSWWRRRDAAPRG